MAKFKALLSPKQFMTVKGIKYKATNGLLITDEKEVIDAAKKNTAAWEQIDIEETDDIDDSVIDVDDDESDPEETDDIDDDSDSEDESEE
jgi:hypothetical protein